MNDRFNSDLKDLNYEVNGVRMNFEEFIEYKKSKTSFNNDEFEVGDKIEFISDGEKGIIINKNIISNGKKIGDFDIQIIDNNGDPVIINDFISDKKIPKIVLANKNSIKKVFKGIKMI